MSGLIGVVVGAGLALVSAIILIWHKEKKEYQRVLAILAGELVNLREHYNLVFAEFPQKLSTPKEELALIMSKYGMPVFSEQNISRFDIMKTQDISALRQLSLVVRNNDIHIDFTLRINSLKDRDGNTDVMAELERIKSRVRYSLSLIDQVMKSIALRNPGINLK